MTAMQSGREAFEAWYAANDNTRKSIERDATGYRLIQTEAAWQAWDAAWQAALAQQPFPARFFASGPQGCAWFDALSLASAMIAAFDKDDDWTITDTEEAPIPANDAYAYIREADRRISVLAALLNQANVDHLREVEALRHYAKAASDLIAADTAYDIAKQAKWDASGIKQQQAAEKAFQSAKSRRSLALSRVLAANNNTRAALAGKTETTND